MVPLGRDVGHRALGIREKTLQAICPADILRTQVEHAWPRELGATIKKHAIATFLALARVGPFV